MNVNINLNSIEKVKNFVSDISGINADFDIASGRYVIDAKSIMGVFSLNLCENLNLAVRVKEGTDENEILRVIQPYVV